MKFRTRQNIVEAVRVADVANIALWSSLPTWIQDAYTCGVLWISGQGVRIGTDMTGQLDDWIIRTHAGHNAISIVWPTPIASEGAKGGPGRRFGNGDMTLSGAVAKWPTPRATRGGSATETVKQMGVGGQLNPTWVEWLMGYPNGYTVLEPWAMQWFQLRPAKRSSD